MFYKRSKDEDRPASAHNGKLLWCPFAEISEQQMKTRGKYRNGYPEGAIVHYTAGRRPGGISWGVKQGYCYFMIQGDGNVIQSFPLDRWGSHAGRSHYPGYGDWVSQYFVGIEIACAGNLTSDVDGEFESWFGTTIPPEEVRIVKENDKNQKRGYYEKFTMAQEMSLITLLLWLHRNNPKVFKMESVLGHDEVAPTRKTDPGGSLFCDMHTFRTFLKANAWRKAEKWKRDYKMMTTAKV